MDIVIELTKSPTPEVLDLLGELDAALSGRGKLCGHVQKVPINRAFPGVAVRPCPTVSSTIY
jgi:hypothetical protein